MIIFSFDCQKNLVLPKVPDQSCYYSRQLYLYNFTVVQGSSKQPLNANTTFSYVWTENEYAKGSNEIASALYDRLNKTELPENITHIRLMADGCVGQNKNLMMLTMCMRWILDHQQIKKIELIFPITGHSYMPPDRVFGNIEKKIRKEEVIISPSQYINFVTEHATVTKLHNIPVLDWKSSAHSIVKTTAQLHFQISKCKRFTLRRSKTKGSVLVRGEIFYNSETGVPKNICKPSKKADMIQPSIISRGVEIKALKLRDVRKLLQKHYGENWEDQSHLIFYKELLSDIDEDELRLSENSTEVETYLEDFCEARDDCDDLRI